MLHGLASRSLASRYVVYNLLPTSHLSHILASTLVGLIANILYITVCHYAQTPPGGGGGFPEFKFPMQQQYSKGDALKEFVGALYYSTDIVMTFSDMF